MKSRLLTSALLLGFASSPGAVTVYWSEAGDNFEAIITGSFSQYELDQAFNSYVAYRGGDDFVTVDESGPAIIAVYGGMVSLYQFDPVKFTRTDMFGISTGGVPTGRDSFGLSFAADEVFLYLPADYIYGSSISQSFFSNRFGLTLDAIDVGDVVLLNGDPFMTFVHVPEPSTYGLILGGLAMAGAAIRRRRLAKA